MASVQRGFSIAEVLIGLALMAVLATFAISKIFNSNNNNTEYRNKVLIQETAHAVEAAYAKYRLNNNPTAATTFADVTPYINYIKVDTTAKTIDEDPPSVATIACNGFVGAACLLMPNGVYILYSSSPTAAFADTSNKHALWIQVDPNGRADHAGQADGANKGVQLKVYFDGKVRSRANQLVDSCNNASAGVACPSGAGRVMAGGDDDPVPDPYWFNWN
jgi:prepilin-type N-terminal cleavage/methylation domain-containing protein